MGHLLLKLIQFRTSIGDDAYGYSPGRGDHIWNVLRLLNRCGNTAFELQELIKKGRKA